MNTVLAILTALPSLAKAILELMKLIEEAFGQGTGVQKKEIVLSTVETLVNDDTMWLKVRNLFSGLINMLALFNFGSSGKDPE
jgi:hypothetical protein